MNYLVIKNSTGKPAELVMKTKIYDRAVGYIIDQVTAIAKAFTKKGHRIGISTDAKRNGYLGHIFIGEDLRKGKTFTENFESQYAFIRYKFCTALFDKKATAVFVNPAHVMFGEDFATFTIIPVK